jgi:hypothetical protein
MKKRKGLIIAGGVLVALAAALLAALWVGPQVLQSEIEERVRQRLEARGIDAEWGAFRSEAGRSFEITDVQVEMPAYGVQFESDRVLVDVGLESVLDGEIYLSEITVEPATAVIDIEPILERLDAEEVAATTTGGNESANLDRLVRKLLENPPVVHLTDASLLVKKGDADLMRVSAPEIAVEEQWGGFEVSFEGEVDVLADELPKVVRRPIPWAFEGTIEPGEKRFEYRVRSPHEGAPLYRLHLPDVLSVQIGSVFGEGTVADRTAALNVEELEVVVGEDEYAALHARAPVAVVSRQKNGRPKIDVRKPSVYVAPAKRGDLRKAWKKLRGAGGPPAVRGDQAGEPSTAPSAEKSLVSRLAGLAARTDFVLDGLAVGVHLEDDAGDVSTLTLLERLDTRIHNGLMRTTGTTAGGEFFAEAEVLPGQRWPHYLVVRVDGVRLEKLPGMARERTELPSRGTSGTVGGRVDLNLALTMPPQGMNGPLTQSPGIGELHVRWTDGMIDLTGVSDEPVEGIDASADFTLSLEPQISKLNIEHGRLGYGPVVVHLEGDVTDFPLDTEIALDFEMERIDCQEAVRSLPAALLGPYDDVVLEGEFEPTGSFKLPLHRPKGFRARFSFEPVEDRFGNRIEKRKDEDAAECTMKGLRADREAWPDIDVAGLAPTGPHRTVTEIPANRPPHRHDDVWWLNRPFVKKITEGLVDPEESEVYVGPGTRTYIPLEQLPTYVGAAMYLSEQIDFYEDGPVSFSLMKKAMRLNLHKGRFVYGGSTVTQQLVKNLFLTRDKTLARKIQETLVSWRVDEVISKDRVLELYLNCIEFGPDIYGIGPAAEYYFGKDARQLSPLEAIFLAMLKPAPWYGPKYVKRGRTPRIPYWSERTQILFDRLVEHGFITKAEAEAQKPYELHWHEDGTYKDPNSIYVPLLD